MQPQLKSRMEGEVLTYFAVMGDEMTGVWRNARDPRHHNERRRRTWQAMRVAELQARMMQTPVRVVLQGSDGKVLYETPISYPCLVTDDEPTVEIEEGAIVEMAMRPTECITRPVHVEPTRRGTVERRAPPRAWRKARVEEMKDLRGAREVGMMIIRKGARR